ncbi:MAG: DUF427 domain-containing protein [Isosphaeraceae bacterium]|nr:DUF427 domain-containing protein [Isosphaeraceae bacterium]
MRIAICEKVSGARLAEGEAEKDVVTYEGNLYFDPSVVNQPALRITERTYTCPYKGTCHWVDMLGQDGKTVRDVAWVYADPKAGHEVIKGRYGFYAGSRGATRQE